MELINVSEDERVSYFYQAAWRGDAEALVQLLLRDATILPNIPDRRQTPLHISSLLGHVRFTEVLLCHVGDLATRVDSSRRTALHLASAEGHIDIVKELLRVNNEPCVNRDDVGRIPLHYAAMRGRTEVVQELIKARPESLSPHDQDKTTVFHLCVTYNHLETLQTLVKLDYATANITTGEPRPPIFIHPDHVGDTILHLAIKLKRVEVISYLLSIIEIREIVKSKKIIGSTAHDILEESPKDFKICEIQHILREAEKEGFGTGSIHPDDGCCIKIIKRIWDYYWKIFVSWMTPNVDKWLQEMRGNLCVVCVFIATITFQGLINPPGGFIQQGLSSSNENSTSSNQLLNVTSFC